MPTVKELQSDESKVLVITPDNAWNPHMDVYVRNEENMLDYLGQILEPNNRPRILLENLPINDMMASSPSISADYINMLLDLGPLNDLECSDPLADCATLGRFYASSTTLNSEDAIESCV